MTDSSHPQSRINRSRAKVQIGTVGKAHGLRGGFFVSGRDEPIPHSYRHVYLSKRADAQRILEVRWVRHRPVIRVEGIARREDVEALTGCEIFVDEAAVTVADDEFLWADLEGRSVLRQDGRLFGVVEAVYNAGASDIAVVSGELGRVELPLIADYLHIPGASADKSAALRLVVDEELFAELWQSN